MGRKCMRRKRICPTDPATLCHILGRLIVKTKEEKIRDGKKREEKIREVRIRKEKRREQRVRRNDIAWSRLVSNHNHMSYQERPLPLRGYDTTVMM